MLGMGSPPSYTLDWHVPVPPEVLMEPLLTREQLAPRTVSTDAVQPPCSWRVAAALRQAGESAAIPSNGRPGLA